MLLFWTAHSCIPHILPIPLTQGTVTPHFQHPQPFQAFSHSCCCLWKGLYNMVPVIAGDKAEWPRRPLSALYPARTGAPDAPALWLRPHSNCLSASATACQWTQCLTQMRQMHCQQCHRGGYSSGLVECHTGLMETKGWLCVPRQWNKIFHSHYRAHWQIAGTATFYCFSLVTSGLQNVVFFAIISFNPCQHMPSTAHCLINLWLPSSESHWFLN